MEKVKLIEICNPKQWKTLATGELMNEGEYPVYGANGIIGYYDRYNHEKETVLITCRGATCGNIHISKEKSYINGNAMALDNLREDVCLKKYLFYFLKQYDMKKIITGSAQPQITVQGLKKIEIKLHDLKKQKAVIEELDNVQEIIDIRKKQIEKLDELIKSQFVEMFGNIYENKKNYLINELDYYTSMITYGLTVRPKFIEKGIDLISAREINTGVIDYDKAPKISEDDYNNLSEKAKPKKNDILFSKTGTIGLCTIVEDEKKFVITQNAARIVPKDNINPIWLLYYLRTDEIQHYCKRQSKGNAVKDFQIQDMKKIPILDCPITLQNEFVGKVKQIDKQKFEVQKSLEEIQKLQESLMNKYFG